MRGVVFLGFSAFLLLIGTLLIGLSSCGANPPIFPSSLKIQHVVVIFQENRAPDNLFHDPVLIARGADIASSGVNSKGQTIPLEQIGLESGYDLSHAHSAFVAMFDQGKMDGADRIPISCPTGQPNCAPRNPQFMYVKPADVKPYFQLAEQYAFGDRMFQTNQGPSFPAHQFIISGTSTPWDGANLFVAENPGYGAGCAAPANAFVALIDGNGNESNSIYPCFEHLTLMDLLKMKGISWRYYTSAGAGSIWTAPNAIQHICGPNALPPNATACTGVDWTNNVVLPNPNDPAPVLTDIANGQLAAVSWVIPGGSASDHPLANDGSGPSWVASIVNAIGQSSYWSNTAIFITWDDWGGWYDHVRPPQVRQNCEYWGCGYVYGFRVPLIVVSPYSRPGYVSHVTHDFGSVLKFIEETYGLQSLRYADAAADDFSDCFNFDQTPLQFQQIAAPLPAEYFLNDRRPQTPPDDD